MYPELARTAFLVACALIALVCAGCAVSIVMRARTRLLARARTVDGRVASLELRAARAQGVRLAATCAKLRTVGFTLPADFFE